MVINYYYKMETQFYYIHGLGSSKKSSKFLELKKQYTNIICLDWKETDNIDYKLNEWLREINSKNVDNVCIIASSTGANFAVQLKNKTKFIHLVLINPLLDINNLFDITIIPKQLRYYLIKIKLLYNSLILLGNLDEVINNKNILQHIKHDNQIIIDKNSTHKFEALNLYYNEIDNYINNINI